MIASEITGAVYDIGNEFGEWLGEKGWLDPAFDIATDIFDFLNDIGEWLGEKGWLDPFFETYDETHEFNPFFLPFFIANKIFPESNNFFLNARSWLLPSDPLALDLDGDGIETIGIGSTVIKFDHNADGIKTGTGWLKPDDGFLVLDKNGNGKIDSGRELFGVDTIKSNGQKATDGLDALADLDSNHDGVFDANDAQFANVRVWRDLNQDGVSQANELTTLDQQGITAIDLNVNLITVDLGNGNTQTATTTFTRTDGSEGAAGNVIEGNAANLDLAHNPFYREFTDRIELSPEIARLPDMQGSGAVRDLREAAQGSSSLASQLQSLADAGLISREDYKDRIENLVEAWAGTASFMTSKAKAQEKIADGGVTMSGGSTAPNASAVEIRYAFITLRYLPPEATTDDISFLYPTATFRSGNGNSDNGSSATLLSETELERREKLTSDLARLEKLIAILEPINGVTFVDLSDDPEEPGVTTGAGTFISAVSFNPDNHDADQPHSGGGIRVLSHQAVYVPISQVQLELLEQSYQTLIDSVYDGLLLQTRLKSYQDAITLTFDENGLHFDVSSMESLFAEQWDAGHARNALADLVDLLRVGSNLLTTVGWNPVPLLRSWIEAAQDQPELQSLLTEFQVITGSENLAGTNQADIIFGQGQDDNLWGDEGADILVGGAGNDVLSGGNGDDRLQGDEGNDYLDGGYGNDTYVFNRGDGQDTLYDYDWTTSNKDIIQFGEGIAPDEVRATRSGDSLILNLKDSADQIVVNYHFCDEYAIEEIHFADGTVWEKAYINDVLVIQSTDGDDALYANDNVHTLSGGLGNDTLDGKETSDSLYGDAGNDTLIVVMRVTTCLMAEPVTTAWKAGQAMILTVSTVATIRTSSLILRVQTR
ncbi:hypothetical protein FACS1894116_00600 [Betaproteobacteria bacterium]|nr:hypothetical protein FACS1894116_00600 [Betaproteobacteria bacterium]GHU28402.1 hypothetical protein FACS189497_03780 [Betaproteobacteria bacterium]